MNRLIDEVSSLYREKKNEVFRMEEEAKELRITLADKSILATDFFKKEERLKELEKRIERSNHFAEGIHFTRKIMIERANEIKASQLELMHEEELEQKSV
ncbi:hypothetical protein [Oceanobacillus massiliensis]|uniref:hypothetical protein n=1 Tax=Oceanobacillus massiliensis TaxID=1465765 RepID=UPI0002896087|nr:hypothetical protein [Oceanobacillus massiliensis]